MTRVKLMLAGLQFNYFLAGEQANRWQYLQIITCFSTKQSMSFELNFCAFFQVPKILNHWTEYYH